MYDGVTFTLFESANEINNWFPLQLEMRLEQEYIKAERRVKQARLRGRHGQEAGAIKDQDQDQA